HDLAGGVEDAAAAGGGALVDRGYVPVHPGIITTAARWAPRAPGRQAPSPGEEGPLPAHHTVGVGGLVAVPVVRGIRALHVRAVPLGLGLLAGVELGVHAPAAGWTAPAGATAGPTTAGPVTARARGPAATRRAAAA